MASETAATDQRIDAQLLDEKKVVDDIKLDGEEIIFQPKETAGKDGVDNIKEGSSATVSNATASDEKPEDALDVQEPKKEEEHEKNGRKDSLLEPEVSVQESEPVISDTKTEDLKDAEVPSISEDEHKPEETPALSTDLEISEDKNVDAEIEAKANNPEPSIDSVIELTNSEDTKNEVQEPVPAEISTTFIPDVSEAPEKDVDSNAPTSIKETVKDLGVESGTPEERTQELSNAVVPNVSEAPEKVDDLNAPTSIEVPVKDLEVESGSPEEQKQEKTTEPHEPISNVPASIEVESGTSEEWTQELSNAVVPNVSEAPEKVDDLHAPTSIEVPVKDLEAESGSPEEQKQEKTTEPQDPILNANSIAGVNEAVESSSYEEKASGDAEAVEKKDDSLEKERSETPVETHGDLEAKTEVPRTPSSEEVENKREDENVEGDIDTFTDLDGSAPVALVSPEGKKAPELVEVVEEKKDETLEGDSIDDTPKVAHDASLEGEKTLEGDKIVDKEKAENEEAVAEVSSEQDKAVETAEIVSKEKDIAINIDKEALGATTKDFDIAPDATEVRSEGESVSAGDQEKNESLKDENPTSVEEPKGLKTAEESPEQVIEEKENKNSVSEKGSPANISRDFDQAVPSTEIVKDTRAPETIEEVKDETSEDLNVKEKDVKVPDRKEEVKVEEAIQTTTDTLENEDLGTEKQESEKTKDQDPIVSSNTGDAKLIKEVTKRESTNLFSKVKRSIVKAKKAILGKSPGPKNVPAEAKDVNS